MRYVSVNYLTEGMVLAKAAYGYGGKLLLAANTALTPKLIQSLKKLDYYGVYIDDEFSKDITPHDVISEELRGSTVNAVMRMVGKIEKGMPITENMSDITSLLRKIIDDVCTSDGVVVNLIDLKVFDSYTYQHSVNVCVLCCVMGVALRLMPDEMYDLALSAILHDIGKLFIDKEILNKPGRLDPEEFEIMKKHSLFGYDFIRNNLYFHSIVHVSVLQHHERYNGTGYPLGKKGDEIPLFARIIAVADVFDAITSQRPYHAPILPSEGVEYILGNSGQHFCPDVVSAFVKKVAPFPVGMAVRLSNGKTGIVSENRAGNLSRPIIKLFPDHSHTNASFIDLCEPDTLHITITEVLY